jgi:hypothetical protein
MTGKNKHYAVWLLALALVIPTGLFGQEEGDYEVGTAVPPVDPGRVLLDITVDVRIQQCH